MELGSKNEWGKLREVVLGSAVNYVGHDRELSFDLFFHENLLNDNAVRSDWYYPRLQERDSAKAASAINRRYVEELEEDLGGMAETLQAHGVSVLRPTELPANQPTIQTLAFSAPVIPALNVRDNTLIIGDEIIETPPMIRSRYFESQLLSNVFGNYFASGARWTVMPRPLMTDNSFDTEGLEGQTAGGPTEVIRSKTDSALDVGYEIMIDAAQCLRLGDNLLVNVSNANHRLGADWLERHLDGRVKVHRVHNLSDSHIDSMVLALREGTLLVRSQEVSDRLPPFLRDWERIIAPAPRPGSFPTYTRDDLILTSSYIDLNVLSLDESTVMVNESSVDLMEQLSKRGFDVIPQRHRHRRLFGGGFHCFTLDTVRD